MKQPLLKSAAVVGLQFGDEGKGLTTSYLCSQIDNPIVVRFNGGHQAGHTVVFNRKRHVFSNIGSGALQGIPTYWSKYCTISPVGFGNEIKKLGFIPIIYINPECPVTTPFDRFANQADAERTGHGSCGVGFGQTIKRQEDYYKLFARDLLYPRVLEMKMWNISRYYRVTSDRAQVIINEFIEDCTTFTNSVKFSDDSILNDYNPVFEGAQGILLDMDYGFFPNVTRSNTTSKNAVSIYPELENVFYVTRGYLTRHGAGYLPNERKLELVNNEDETNVNNVWQGEFRTAPLCYETLNYALDVDSQFFNCKKHLVITCTDQYPVDIDQLLRELKWHDFDGVYTSNGPSLDNITKYK